MVSKLEVNIRNLFMSCEELSKDETNFWRLKKYIKYLDTMLEELKETNENINQKAFSDYYAQLANLKTITNYTESENRPIEKKYKSVTIQKATGSEVLKEINQINNSKYYSELRKELMGGDNIRKRNPQADENMGQAMKYYSDVQERITEDMLSLTRSLKEQTETANKILKRDTEVVGKSTQLTDTNLSSLSKEADKLQEHSRKAWKCWMWIMIALVMMIFIFMVLFMKIMKKKI